MAGHEELSHWTGKSKKSRKTIQWNKQQANIQKLYTFMKWIE